MLSAAEKRWLVRHYYRHPFWATGLPGTLRWMGTTTMTAFQKAVIVLVAAALVLTGTAFATVQVECSAPVTTVSDNPLLRPSPAKPDSRHLWESCR